ncbi:MAG: NAD(P)-dependent alcohol dehydrogenase [Chloroflexota bacterium]|nr:NAD(P)-dependent alcohol dehydrogenase [Chloroflexota bacterium]
MKAIVYNSYGSPDVLHLQEVAEPTLAHDHVLVKIHATSVNAADWLFLRGDALLVRLMAGGVRSPKNKTLGVDTAGVVEAVGASVTRFKPGDAVYGDLSTSGAGGFAEYVAVPEKFLALKPTTLSFEAAAAVPLAGSTALQAVRDAGAVQPGQTVLINGASGGVGSFAVQIAKVFGAHVSATCSTGKMDMVAALGAERVIDYTRTDITAQGGRYDLVVDAAAHRPFSDYASVLNPGGRYVVVGGALGRIFRALLLGPVASLRGGKTFGAMSQKPNQTDLIALKALIEEGKIIPALDRCFPLDQTAEAMRYFGAGQVRGKVVVRVIGGA